jgi:hypothetical protein
MPLAIYRMEFTRDEINLIGNALGKMPYEVVAPFISKLKGMAQAQELEFQKGEDDARRAQVTHEDGAGQQAGSQGNGRAEAR